MYVCHASFFLVTSVRYPEVDELILTLHKPWQRTAAPKALIFPIDFGAIVPSRSTIVNGQQASG